MEIAELLINGAFLVGGGFLGKGVEWVLAKSKVKIEEEKAESQVKTTELDKAAQMYREIAADLRKDIDEMFAHLQKVEEQRLDCLVSNAGLKAENKLLKAENDELRAEVARLEKALEAFGK